MKHIVHLSLLTLVAVFVVFSSNANAQNYRSWVSRSGSDSAACTQTAPCATFQVALSKTRDNAVISVIDAANYQGLTIDKSITIDGTGTLAMITVNLWGITVSKAGAKVVLRGLELDGAAGPGDNPACVGVLVTQPATLILEDVRIGNMHLSCSYPAGVLLQAASGLTSASLNNVSINNVDRGLVVEGSGNTQLSINNTTISSSIGHGILVMPSAGTTRVAIQNSKAVNNGGTGLMIAPTGNAKVNTTVIGSGMDGNVIGIRSFPAGSAVSNMTISDTSASNNAGGIHASGKGVVSIIRGAIGGNSSYGVGAVAPAAVRIGSSVVSGNTLGFSGPISSYGNNQMHGNSSPGSSSPLPTSGMP